MIRAVPDVAALSAYALADLSGIDANHILSLSQNESLRPPSPRALEATAQALTEGHLYPDPDWRALRAAIAELHGLDAAAILCGAGSMELIACIARAFADGTRAVLAPAHSYPFFRTATALARSRFDTAPEPGGIVSAEALLNAVRPDTRVVFVANPGNPTGTRIRAQDLRRLRESLPETTLLVIDEAYGEFADALDAPLFGLVDRGDTIVLRSFSKAYGLAGHRVGWGYFPPHVAAEVRKVMMPNNISAAAQAAATAAVHDQAYMQETCALTTTIANSTRTRLKASGFDVPESFTNFLLIRLPDTNRAEHAEQALRAQGIILRRQAGVGLPQCLRMTIGTKAQMDRATTALALWKEENDP